MKKNTGKNMLLFKISSNAISIAESLNTINKNNKLIPQLPHINLHYKLIFRYLPKIKKIFEKVFKVRTYYQLIKSKTLNIYQLNKIVRYQKKILMSTNYIKKYIRNNIIVDACNRGVNVSDYIL